MNVVSGRVWKFGDNIDTDAMFPGFALRLPVAEGARHVFYALRPGWVDEVQPGDVLVAGRNFGIGSSRPVPLLFRELGIAAVVAEEVNSLFFRNCINYGIPAVTAPGVGDMLQEGDEAEIDVREGWVRNVGSGAKMQGERFPQFVLDILDAGGVIPKLRRDGYLPA